MAKEKQENELETGTKTDVSIDLAVEQKVEDLVSETTKKISAYNIINEFENENIIQTSPEIVKNLEETLEKIKSESNIEFDDDISDEETKKIEGELKRLGYI